MAVNYEYKVMWTVVYANIIGMSFHPGNRDVEGCEGYLWSMQDCAHLADDAMKEYLCRFSEPQPLG